jgi:hypothetical protein
MPVIKTDLSGHIEPEIVKEAGPFTLKVVAVDLRTVNVKGTERDIIDVLFRIMDSGLINPKPVKYGIWLPSASQEASHKNSAQGQLIRFRKAIGDTAPDTDEFDTDTWKGCELSATLKVVEDDQYGDRNEIRRIIA